MTLKIGKANLEIKAEGCIGCGTKGSAGWHEAKRIRVSIQNSLSPAAAARIQEIPIYSCADCQERREAKSVRDDDG